LKLTDSSLALISAFLDSASSDLNLTRASFSFFFSASFSAFFFFYSSSAFFLSSSRALSFLVNSANSACASARVKVAVPTPEAMMPSSSSFLNSSLSLSMSA
jgi:hypothetical protein